MITKSQIRAQLEQLGVPCDKPLIVHVSLRAVGKIDGGGQTLLDCLIERVTKRGGVLVVPSHTWANLLNDRQIKLDMTDSKTCVGTFADIATADARGTRTVNPTHSVTVFGDKAVVGEFIKGERETLTPNAPQGCYGKIYDNDGSVLLIGVGHNKNTYMHCVEEMMGVEDRLTLEPVKMLVKLPDGSIFEKDFHYMTERLGDVSARFPKYEPAFRLYGVIKDGLIGNAKTQLCSARGIKNVMELVRERSAKRELLSDDTPLDENLYV